MARTSKSRRTATPDLRLPGTLGACLLDPPAGDLAYWLADPASGTLQHSSGMEAVLGVPAGSLGGSLANFYALVHATDRARVMRWVNGLCESRNIEEIAFRTAATGPAGRWINAWGEALRRGRGKTPLLRGSLRDSSEWHRLSLAANISEGYLAQRPDGGAAVAYRYALDGDRGVEFVSASIADLCGYTRDDFLGDGGRPLSSLIHPQDRAGFEAAVASCSEASPDYDLDYRICCRDGSTRWVYDRGRLIGGCAGARIVEGVMGEPGRGLPDRTPGEETLATLTAFFEHSPHEIIVKDLDGRYRYFNADAERRWGLDRAAVVGKLPSDIFPAEFADGFQSAVEEVVRSGRPVTVEEQIPGVDGLATQLCVRFPIRNARGEVTAVGSIATDITDIKRAGEMVANIARGLSARTGAEFFRSLVEHLANALGVDFALVGELPAGQADRIQTIAVFADGSHAENFQYELRDTPCANVVGQSACVYATGVQELFPRDHLLTEMQVDGYAGSPLFDSEGRAMGLLVVLDRKPIQDQALAQSMLQIFVARAAAEMQRQRSDRTLRESEERYRAFLANSTEAIWRYDFEPPVPTALPPAQQVERICATGILAECNPAMAALYGYESPQAMIGLPIAELMQHRDLAGLIGQFVDGGYRLANAEFPDRRAGRDPQHTAVNASGFLVDGSLTRIWGTDRDVTERYRHLAELEHRANHDSLTGLPNRERLRKRLDALLGERAPAALLLMDLDRFKEINDTLGHHIGDVILRELADRLRATVETKAGMVTRLGGDEFGILLAGGRCTLEDAVALAQAVNAAVRRPFDMDGLNLELGSSIGIALAPQDGTETSELLRCADVAMYRAKRHADDFARYRLDLDEHSPRRLRLMSDLRRAIAENQLFLRYQPKVSLRDGRTLGLEALVRWRHPEHGLIPPAQFVPLAEMGDSIRPLTLWVMERAMRDWRAWSDAGLDTTVAVNLSARNLIDDDLPGAVARLLEAHAVPASALECEITESALITDPERAEGTVRRLAELGLRFAIDDYGTGYSSLAFLKRLPLHALKIDLSFVRQMTASEQDAVIVRSTINLARNLHLTVIAEGVEDRRTLQALRAAGCDQAQGYLFAEPMAAEQVPGWLGTTVRVD